MRRASLPLNPEAVKKADEVILAKTNGRKLDPTDPNDAALRAEWMNLYEAAGGKVTRQQRRRKPAEPREPCGTKFIDLHYYNQDGTGVAGASYLVKSGSTGKILSEGQLDGDGYKHIDGISDDEVGIVYWFHDDPKKYEVVKKPIPNPDYEPGPTAMDRLLAEVKKQAKEQAIQSLKQGLLAPFGLSMYADQLTTENLEWLGGGPGR